MSKVIWIDVETTGLNPDVHGLVEVGYIIEIDGEEIEKEVFKINPLTYSREVEIDSKALEINGKSLYDLKSYEDSNRVLELFLYSIGKHIDKTDKKDKFVIKGYNVGFDINFLMAWFKDCNNDYFGAWFSYKEIDVFALVKVLKDQNMFETENDKLLTICKHFDIGLNAHNALDDIVATKKLYTILTDKYIVKKASDGNESIQER